MLEFNGFVYKFVLLLHLLTVIVAVGSSFVEGLALSSLAAVHARRGERAVDCGKA